MTTTHPRENVAGSAPEHQGGPTGPAQWQPAVLRVTRDEVRVLHRSIPVLANRIRHQRTTDPGEACRTIVLDIAGVPPAPAPAPLLFLLGLLRRLADTDARIDITGVTPALVAAMTAFDMPDGVSLVDTRGRRWPG
jgi:hypothetical protein